MKHMVVPSVNILLFRDEKVMLSQRKNTGWMDGYLCIPGGHVEKGETPLLAAVRELKEELDLDVAPDMLELFCLAYRNSTPNEYVGFEFKLNAKNLNPINNEPDKCEELVWIDVDKLPQNVIPQFAEILTDGYKNGKMYLELGYT